MVLDDICEGIVHLQGVAAHRLRITVLDTFALNSHSFPLPQLLTAST